MNDKQTYRYTPWWLPAALIVALLLVLGLTTALVLNQGKPAPAVAQDKGSSKDAVYSWRLITTWPKNFPGLGRAPETFARYVYEMSAGELAIRVFGAREIVPPMGVFDAVSNGTVQMGHSAAYYWKGKIPAAPFFTSVPFGMNVQEMNAWLHYGEGLTLWREAYEPFNLIPFAGGNTGVQMGGWFNKEINTPDDIKGLKMRIPGIGGEVFSRAGGEAVNIPGGELYTSLQSGVIDATEWVGPYNDLTFGFQQIAQYYYYPGWHEPGPSLEFIINKDAYASLPVHLQKIVEIAARAVNQDMLDEYTFNNHTALQNLKDEGIDIRAFSPAVLATFEQAAMSLYEEQAKKDPFYARVYKSYFRFLKSAKAYHQISEQAYYDLR